MLCLNVFMELKLTSIGRLFQTLTTLSQKKVQRISVLCGLKLYIYENMTSSLGNRTECEKLVDVNINEPENDLVTPHKDTGAIVARGVCRRRLKPSYLSIATWVAACHFSRSLFNYV